MTEKSAELYMLYHQKSWAQVKPGSTRRAASHTFSPSTSRLVVVAYDLGRPPTGQEYRCWVEVGGKRQNVGRMFFARDLAYWVGQTPGVGDLPAGTTFGVSLADVNAASPLRRAIADLALDLTGDPQEEPKKKGLLSLLF